MQYTASQTDLQGKVSAEHHVHLKKHDQGCAYP